MTKSITKYTLAIGAIVASSHFATPAAAEVAGLPGEFTANVGVVSEYYFRGISQSDDGPALQGGIDWSMEVAAPISVYLGFWGSNVDFNDGNDGATVEMDLYGGLKGEIFKTGITWDAGAIYYSYPGARNSLNYDFLEFKGALGYDFDVAAVSASVNYSPNYFGDSGKAFYGKLGVNVPVPVIENFGVAGYVARQTIDKSSRFGSPSYNEWNVGAYYAYSGFNFGLNYSDTDLKPNSTDGKGPAVIASISRSF